VRALAILLLAAALPAAAQEARPAPDYFVGAAHDFTTANALAVSCTRISIDPGAAGRRSTEVIERLAADGFDPATLEQDMADPSEIFMERRAAFLEKHGLNDAAPEGAVCAAALAEIAEGTGVGALLLEVEG
jgi:hypothetical protein